MFSYLHRNISSLFTKQRLLSLLLVLNIVISCLVICFSYGLYQNYNMIVLQGEKEEYTELSVLINNEDRSPLYEANGQEFIKTADISPQMILELLGSFSDDTKNNLDYLYVSMAVKTPLSVNAGIVSADTSDESTDYYSDDASSFFLTINYACTVEGDMFVDANRLGNAFTNEQYDSGEKIAIVLDSLFDEHKSFEEVISNVDGSSLRWHIRTLPEGTDSLIIGGEEYKIIKKLPDYEMGLSYVLIPLTATPESARAVTGMCGFEGASSCFSLLFNETVTREQYADIQSCVSRVMGEKIYLQPIEFTDSTEIYYFKTIMLISVVIAVLAAINMAILYRYILEKRSSELAIFRICGCSKGKAIASYLLECTVINVPLFALTQLVYHKLIMPRLTGLFPNMEGAYSLKLYIAILGIYVSASMLVMLIMISVTISRHSLVNLKKSARSTSRFSIMKVFEVIQLAAVLSMMIMIVSAIVSRYSLFTPFEEYLTRKGYMVTASSMAPGIYPDEFEEIIGDADYIMNQYINAYDGDIPFDGIAYSNEFIEAYTPPISEGVWLDSADFTYESSGYIPAVITSCEGRYKVGDVLESDIIMNFEDPSDTLKVRYKIIGVLKDKISIASYIFDNYGSESYSEIYGVFSDGFERNDFLLTKISDNYALYNANSFLWGTQFVFCDDLTDDEYSDIGRRLDLKEGLSATPLSEVYKNSLDHIYEQMYTLFPIAVCIFILTIISTVSISAIYTKRQLRNYAIFYICGARWRTCALKSLKNGAITCAVSAVLSALILVIGKATLLKETVISFGIWHFAVCAGVIVLYLALSMIMPLSIIGSSEPREVLKEE